MKLLIGGLHTIETFTRMLLEVVIMRSYALRNGKLLPGFFLIFLLCGCPIRATTVDVIYLMPENFEGGVGIFFDQKDGVEPDFNGTEYIFTVPKDGVLKVGIGAKAASGTPRFFLVKENGNRTELELLYPKGPKYPDGMRTRNDLSNEERDNKVFAIVYESGNFNTANGIVRFRSFLICKPKDLNYEYAQMQQKITNVQRTFPR